MNEQDSDWCSLHQRPDKSNSPCPYCDSMDRARDNYKDDMIDKSRDRYDED